MFFNFVHKDDLEFVSSAFTNHLVNNAEFYIEHRITLLNGKIKHVLEQCQTIKDELGNNIRSLGIVMDITDRVSSNQKISEQKEQYISLYEEYKAQNEELQKAKEIAEQSNSLKTEFLHNISHEIRTPMNGIVGFAELLANECFDDEKRKFYTKIIIDSSQNLLNIIDNIIEISKLETKQISITETETNINTTLDYIYNVFSLRSKQNNIPLFLKKNINENHSLIFIDNLKLQKVLTNIVDNAFKYTNSGYIELGNNIIENKLHIYIKDTGVGISSSLQNIIFERFKQTKDNVNKKTDGIGLGLAIAKENIELMNGEITVKSELNQGTIFTIILPYKPINNIFPQIQESKISEKYILVAEDEDVNYLFVELLIKKRYPEIKIIHAKNGSEAVDECKKDNNIFLVFLDIKMPILNGFDAAIEILKINNKLPLVALTAYNNDEDRFLADKIGFTDFIPKPIDKIKFYNLINKLLKISTNSQ
jgi:signal transduction histidine kinase/CheY-like chemotaxis protein